MSTIEQTSAKRLVENTGIYFIGSFVSKIMTVLMLPVITVRLSTSDYGYYDMITTYAMVFMPVFSLQVIDAVFRFLFEADMYEREQQIANVWIILAVGSICMLIVISLANLVINIPHWQCFFIFYLATLFSAMYQRIARSIGKNKVYALSGIINTVSMVIFQLIAMYCFEPSLAGMVIGYALSQVISCIYLEVHTGALKGFSLRHYNLNLIKKMIEFGFPLVPINISWWSISALNKLVIVSFLGIEANGVFAITARFTTLLAFAADIFQRAWQESAIVEYKNACKTSFFSSIFEKYSSFIFCVCAASFPIIKIIFPFLIAKSYCKAWIYVAPAMLGTALSSVAAFYGSGYLASGKTKESLFTTIFGALLNVAVCFLLIKPLGLFAPAIGTIVAYFYMWIARQVTMQEYFPIKLKVQSYLVYILITLLSLIAYYTGGIVINICLLALIITLTLFLNKDVLHILNLKLLKSS